MKNTVVTIILLFIIQLSKGQGIKFENIDLKQALEQAKKNDKLVFLDCYTSWCAPCKLLDKNVFTQEKVGDLFNLHFINIKLNMEQEELRPLAQNYRISSYPTLLFLDANGKMLHKVAGNMKAEDLLNFAHIAISEPEKQLNTLNKRYNEGERGIVFILDYMETLKYASERTMMVQVSQSFLNETEKSAFLQAEVFDFLLLSKALTYKSDVYNYIVDNKDTLYATNGIGKDKFNHVICTCIKSHLQNQARNLDIDELKNVVEQSKTDFKLSNQLMFEAELFGNWYLQHQQYDNWINQIKTSANAMVAVNKEAAYLFLIQTTYHISKDPLFKTIDGAFDEGIILLLKAQEIAGDKISHYYGLANLYYLTGNKAKALESIKRYEHINQEHKGQIPEHFLKLKSKVVEM
ncbi:thioredoxin fold domain-containing protein [Carboxylicivirga sp. RSCT41]|uniref:thioredoxin fold domain-containing protein n=1 Tax=Carboxylicivirga agarovorans TaxID=3417570 RepID=UPI003D33F06E